MQGRARLMKFKLFCATFHEDGNQWLLMCSEPVFPVTRMSGVVVNMLSDQRAGEWRELWDLVWDVK